MLACSTLRFIVAPTILFDRLVVLNFTTALLEAVLRTSTLTDLTAPVASDKANCDTRLQHARGC